MMRLSPALLLAAVILPAFASPLAAQDDQDHQEHYEEVLACAAKADFLANVYRTGGGDALPDNREVGNAIKARLLPVLAYEGHRMGMTAGEIIEDINTTLADYHRTTLARLNTLTPVRQSDEFNLIVRQVNLCGAMPVIQVSSE